MCFDIKILNQEQKCKPGVSNITDVLEEVTNSVLNVCGRVTLQGSVQTVMSKGKALCKQEAILTDNSGTIRLVLWENDISKVSSASTYTLSNVVLKEFQEVKYLTLNKSSTIKISETVITREDTPLSEGLPNTQFVNFPADGLSSLQRFSSCIKCRTKLILNATKKTVKCMECGLGQLKVRCEQRMLADVLFKNEGKLENLMLFDDKLKQLYEIYQEQTNTPNNLETLDDDDIMEFLLTVEAKVFYNGKKNVISIQKL